MLAHLDTHAAALLCAGRTRDFGKRSRRLFERAELAVSEFVRLELQLLYEVGRIDVGPDEILGDLAAQCGVRVLDVSSQVMAEAMTLGWTRDPFDRVIVATALVHDATLITRDDKITAHLDATAW